MIKKYISNGQKFIHFTYKWNIDAIKQTGLKPSISGQMEIDNNNGAGLYCCLYDDIYAQNTILNFMENDVDWRMVEEFLGNSESDEYIPIEDFVVAIVFKYSGEYYKCIEDENEFVKKGYIVIPTKSLNQEPIIESKYLIIEES